MILMNAIFLIHVDGSLLSTTHQSSMSIIVSFTGFISPNVITSTSKLVATGIAIMCL